MYEDAPLEDTWITTWLDRNYTGAPDECSSCFRNGEIIKANDCKKHI